MRQYWLTEFQGAEVAHQLRKTELVVNNEENLEVG